MLTKRNTGLVFMPRYGATEDMVASTGPGMDRSERRLADGRSVTIRPIRSADEALVREFVAGLSAESRYLRFHKWVASPSDRLIHFLTDIDHDRHVAFVCTFKHGQTEQIIGEARYIAEPGSKRCELGIVVADPWRKSGIAGLLLATLIQAARARGFEQMEGMVLRTNSSMLRFARALGFTLVHDADERDTVRIVKPL